MFSAGFTKLPEDKIIRNCFPGSEERLPKIDSIGFAYDFSGTMKQYKAKCIGRDNSTYDIEILREFTATEYEIDKLESRIRTHRNGAHGYYNIGGDSCVICRNLYKDLRTLKGIQ